MSFVWGANPISGIGGISYHIAQSSSNPSGGSAYDIDFRVVCSGTAFGDQGTYDSNDDILREPTMNALGLTEPLPRWCVEKQEAVAFLIPPVVSRGDVDSPLSFCL